MSAPAISLLVHDDSSYLSQVLTSFSSEVPTFAFVSRTPWYGEPGDWESAADVARQAGAEVVLGDWHTEEAHRRAAQEHLLEKGFTHALIPDGDEILEPRLLQSLIDIAEKGLAERVYVEWDTYWKSPEYVIRPRERFTPLMLIDLRAASPLTQLAQSKPEVQFHYGKLACSLGGFGDCACTRCEPAHWGFVQLD